jgi:hypothetical protein
VSRHLQEIVRAGPVEAKDLVGEQALWGSKTVYMWLTCGFSCDDGRAAGSIAGS